MSSKTVGINKGLKSLLDEVAYDGESVDATISRLLDQVDNVDVCELDSTRANIHISEETFKRLNDAKLFSTESHISVIFRLIQSQH
jgi:hypothetical protein